MSNLGEAVAMAPLAQAAQEVCAEYSRRVHELECTVNQLMDELEQTRNALTNNRLANQPTALQMPPQGRSF